MEKEYAQALFDLAQKPQASPKDLVERLIKHLDETGRMKLLPHILREYRRIEARNEAFEDLLEVASEQEASAAAKEAGALGISASPVVNPDLVTGWRARSGSRLVDRSGKRALVDLYRAIAESA
jgi:F0F1-type ATP synthase delta subunit